jgi:hypothetical protein
LGDYDGQRLLLLFTYYYIIPYHLHRRRSRWKTSGRQPIASLTTVDGIRHDMNMKITREHTKKPVFRAGHDDEGAAVAYWQPQQNSWRKEVRTGRRTTNEQTVYSCRVTTSEIRIIIIILYLTVVTILTLEAQNMHT